MKIEKIIIGTIVVVIGLLFLQGYLTSEAKTACINSGGSWQVVGTSTIYVQTGDVMLPLESDKYACKSNN